MSEPAIKTENTKTNSRFRNFIKMVKEKLKNSELAEMVVVDSEIVSREEFEALLRTDEARKAVNNIVTLEKVVEYRRDRFVRGSDETKDELAHVKNAKSSGKEEKKIKLKEPNERQYYK